jgi:hypothetical protein
MNYFDWWSNPDLLYNQLSFMRYYSCIQLCNTCKTLRNIARSNEIIKKIMFSKFSTELFYLYMQRMLHRFTIGVFSKDNIMHPVESISKNKKFFHIYKRFDDNYKETSRNIFSRIVQNSIIHDYSYHSITITEYYTNRNINCYTSSIRDWIDSYELGDRKDLEYDLLPSINAFYFPYIKTNNTVYCSIVTRKRKYKFTLSRTRAVPENKIHFLQ